jgi:hypothetical protein
MPFLFRRPGWLGVPGHEHPSTSEATVCLRRSANQGVNRRTCNYQNLCNGWDYSPVRNVGGGCNDHILSMRIWK